MVIGRIWGLLVSLLFSLGVCFLWGYVFAWWVILLLFIFVFLDSTPGSARLSEAGASGAAAGEDADATVHNISSSDDAQVTPRKSFLMNGSFEETARNAHATSSPELTPTGVPYPSIEGQRLTPVDSEGYPCPVAGTSPLRDSLGRPVRPVSTLSEAGVRLQSISAWYLFRRMGLTSTVREERLSAAVDEYNQEFQAVSDALDYEPVGPGDDSDVSDIPLQRLTVQGIISPVLFLLLFSSSMWFLDNGDGVITLDDSQESVPSRPISAFKSLPSRSTKLCGQHHQGDRGNRR